MKLLIRQHNNIFPMFAVAILLAVSIVRIPVADGYMRSLFQMITEAGVFFLFAVFIYCFVNKWVGLFLALTVFSTIYPSFGKWSHMARGAVVVGCLWYTLIVLTVKDTRYLLNAICIIALANIFFAILQYCNMDPYSVVTFGLMKSASSQITGLMANKNMLSALIAFSLPAFFRKRWVWFVPLIFYGLTIASSTGGALSAVTMTFIYFFLKDGKGAVKKNAVAMIALSVWACFFFFEIDSPFVVETVKSEYALSENPNITIGGSAKQRQDAWVKGLKLYYQNRPFFGYGIGHWKLVFKKISPPGGSVMVQAHNEFVQGLFEMGVLFPVLVFGYFVGIIRRYRKEAILSATTIGIIALNSLVNFPFHVATTAILAVTWMAIFEVQNKKARLISSVQ